MSRGEYDKRCGPLLTKSQRQYIDHKTGTTEVGFATSEGQSPPDDSSRSREVKRQIKNEKATVSHVSTVLRAVTNDMERIEKFYSHVESDSEEFLDLLFAIQDTLKALEFVVDRWKAQADARTERWDEREAEWAEGRRKLQEILAPLYDGLDDSENPGAEFDERTQALKTVCDKGLTEVFRYVATTPDKKQIHERELKQKKGGWSWQQWATNVLEKELGVVEGDVWGQKRKSFVLNPRGEAVYAALESLLESSYVDRYQEADESRERAAFKALSKPYPPL